MSDQTRPLRVLQSFPHKIGAGRICTTAWHQAGGVAAAGADLLVMTGAVVRPLPEGIRVRTTLARGRYAVPYRALGGKRALQLHDRLVARALPKLAGEIDIIHAWPVGALHTLRAARRLGIPTVLERCNAHTRFAYEVVRDECERLDVQLPPGHEHAYNEEILELEEREYALADKLLCPSELVVETFVDQGFREQQLIRHTYGYDESLFFGSDVPRATDAGGLSALFVGVCAVRKGLHYALEAWLASPASETGTFRIAGEFLPDYEARLASMLAHPSVEVLGHRTDVPELMRTSDVVVLPSIEEGFGLVCVEAMAAGAVPMVSDACTEVCVDDVNALVHRVGDVGAIREQFTRLHQDRDVLERLRARTLRDAPDHTWTRAGERLLEVYEEVVAEYAGRELTRAA
jgi:glycosyltransferase involved in cell wall biosynthesis